MPKKRKKINATGRNNMEFFVKLTYNVLDSVAWKSASPEAHSLYIALRRRYNGNNNGEISMSCREAAQIIHGSKSTASKKLKELQDHGLIKMHTIGMFTYREASTWILTNEMYNNQPPTNDWKRYGQYLEQSNPDITRNC